MNIRHLFSKIFAFIRKALASLLPSIESLKWASYLLFFSFALIVIFSSTDMIRSIGVFYASLFLIIMFTLALLSGLLLNLVIALLLKIPEFFRTTLGAIFIISLALFYVNFQVVILSYLYLVFSISILAISLHQILKKRKEPRKLLQWITTYFLLLVTTSAVILWSYWLIQTGTDMDQPTIASLQTDYRPIPINLSDPSEPGVYQVFSLTYGSGKDRHRKEFAEDADLVTEPVDGSKFLKSWKGIAGKLRTWHFGHDTEKLPLNGTVWYPDGVGPFPLVLIVHGNHLAQEYSDPGYAYLGKHWASRGMITVSVDQNYLNGSFTDVFGGLSDENDARGWLLLEHLRQWQKWNDTPDNVFYHRVDMEKIALAGHSRGGEAVAHAALFNRLPYYPDDATVSFDYGFDIVSLIAIAPSDSQYQPSIMKTPLEDVNYFTLHGSHDADVSSFSGQRQLERISFSPDFSGFAAALYIFNANHGQFNTIWGSKDSSSPHINHYNLKQLMTGEEQRKIGKVFMTAFLEATLMSSGEYEVLFSDYRSAGESWLPETVYLQQYRNARMVPICDYSEDLDITTTTVPNGKIVGNNLSDWYERRIGLKHYSMDSKGVYIGWNTENDTLAASYQLSLPEDFQSSRFLYFLIADTGNSPTSHQKDNDDNPANSLGYNLDNADVTAENKEGVQSEEDETEKIDYIDFTIEITDDKGRVVTFPLSSFSPLQKMLEAKMGKLDLIHPTPYGEAILQIFTFDLDNYTDAENDFDPHEIREMELIFDLTPKGMILIGEIGKIVP
jgi:hypothetical protein